MSLDQNMHIELTKDEVEITLCIFRDHLGKLLTNWWDSTKGSEEESDYKGFILHTMGLIKTFTEQGGDVEHWKAALELCKFREFTIEGE